LKTGMDGTTTFNDSGIWADDKLTAEFHQTESVQRTNQQRN